MPEPVRWLAQLLPLTHFVELIRGVVLRAAPLRDLWLPIYKLILLTGVVLTIVTLRFRKRLD
jgi:ABC-2 type transport system permease protein